jgi:hypothetical protein
MQSFSHFFPLGGYVCFSKNIFLEKNICCEGYLFVAKGIHFSFIVLNEANKNIYNKDTILESNYEMIIK